MNLRALQFSLVLMLIASGGPGLLGQVAASNPTKLNPDVEAIIKEHNKKDTNHDGVVSLDEEIAYAKQEAPGKFKGTDSTLPVLGKPGPGTKAVYDGTINSWIERNLQIRKSVFNAKDANDPAKFGWTSNAGESDYYTVDAAIVLTNLVAPRKFTVANQDVFWSVMPVFEAHFSNQNNTHSVHNSQDSLLYAVPISFTYSPLPQLSNQAIKDMMAGPVYNEPDSEYQTSKWIQGGEVMVFPVYRTDVENDIKALEVGLFWRPGTWVATGLNVRKFLIKDFLSFRWDPMVGVEIGRYEDGKPKLAPGIPDDYSRGIVRLHGEIGITSRLAITGDYTRRYNLPSPHKDFHYGELSLIYQLDADRIAPAADANGEPDFDRKTGKPKRIFIPGHFKLGFTWKDGKDAPAFKQVDTYTAWLGAQF